MILLNIWKKNQIKKKLNTMGKKAKEHRKRVQKRNDRIKMEQRRYEKMMNEMMAKQMELLKQQESQENQNTPQQ